MEISGWDLCIAMVKVVAYAATLGAAGGVFFLVYAGELVPPALRAALARHVAFLLPFGMIASGLKLLLLAGSMTGLAGMMDAALLTLSLGRSCRARNSGGTGAGTAAAGGSAGAGARDGSSTGGGLRLGADVSSST